MGLSDGCHSTLPTTVRRASSIAQRPKLVQGEHGESLRMNQVLSEVSRVLP